MVEHQGRNQRRRFVAIHLAVPRRKQRDRALIGLPFGLMRLQRGQHLAGKKQFETAVDVFLNAQIVFRLHLVPGAADHIGDLPRTVLRGKYSADVIRIIARKRVLIRAHHHAARGIVRLRQLIERNHSLPLEVAGRAIHRHVARISPPDGQESRGVVSHVSVHVGINEILPGTAETRYGMLEILPVARAIDVQKRLGHRPRFGRRPLQSKNLTVGLLKHRAVPRYPIRHFLRALPPDHDQLAFLPCLLQMVLKHILTRAEVDFFLVKILHVESEI